MSVRAAIEFAVALAAAVGCAASWIASRTTVVIPPVGDGEPATTSISYYPPWLFAAFVLGTLAGVLLVLATVRVCTSTRRETTYPGARSRPTSVQ